LANNLRARSYSQFSDSSLTAANQISSEFGFAWKANDKIERAAGTSPKIKKNETNKCNNKLLAILCY
jgi:hypothetical protein